MHAKATTALTALPVLAICGMAAGQLGLGAPTMKLSGALYDFRHDDPDFATPSAFSNAGSVSATLGDDGRPVYKGSGKVIASNALDSSGRPIAPHMVNPFEAGDLPADEPVYLNDAWGNLAYAINLEGVTYNEDGTSTWTYFVEEIPGGKDLSHWNLGLDPSHTLMPGTTPGYSVGVDESTGFYGIKWDVDDGFASGYFDIVLDDHYDAAIRESGVLAKGGKSADTGDILAPSTEVVPEGIGGGCVPISDTPATLGADDDAGIGSTGSFARWFEFTPGTNLAATYSLLFTEVEPGVFEFSSADFRPIDGELYGNGPDGSNRDFTMHIHAEFEHLGDFGGYFSYTGDGDMWVFVNGTLMIDLSGCAEGASQVADLDRLCLEPGTHTLDLFYAQRNGGAVEMETNLSLKTSMAGLPLMALHD